MHKPHEHGHSAKHTSNAKHHASSKHKPAHHRKPEHHVSTQHVAGKSPHKHKPRKLSYGISCVLEALADIAPFKVTDFDIAELYDLTPKTEDGITIKHGLMAAAIYGLADHFPVYSETEFLLPGTIVGMTLPEGSHAAAVVEDGIIMWGEKVPLGDYIDFIEEAWIVTWL